MSCSMERDGASHISQDKELFFFSFLESHRKSTNKKNVKTPAGKVLRLPKDNMRIFSQFVIVPRLPSEDSVLQIFSRNLRRLL